MKFIKPAHDIKQATELIKFMQGIYYSIDGVDNEKPVEMSIIIDNGFDIDIIVFDNTVISTLVEDRGLKPCVPWELYTFMDLMRNAGYILINHHPGSSIARFTKTESDSTCAACLADCMYTGSRIDIPVNVSGYFEAVSVKLCLRCMDKYKTELSKLVDTSPCDNACDKDNSYDGSQKVGFFRRIFNKFRK